MYNHRHIPYCTPGITDLGFPSQFTKGLLYSVLLYSDL
jgi:hypothetical protein